MKEEGLVFDREAIIKRIYLVCQTKHRQRIIPVVNCTGVLVHTNLGRSPLAEYVWDAAKQVNCGYSNVEFDLEKGKRGNRSDSIATLVGLLVGAQSALVVNNNAAAVFLLLSALAKGKEVLISRGELVQIGGGFRIPDILEQSGAKLVEVGTTNITTVDDYTRHITENTAMVLKVHTSNFAIKGFARTPSVQEIAAVLPKRIILAVDQGSGVITTDLPGETSLRECLKQGAHLATFSGDKILGSVQAGCIAGKRPLIQTLGKHPLYRVLRPGKTVLSLFEEALIERLNGTEGVSLALGRRGPQQLRSLGEAIIHGLPPTIVRLVEAPMTLGGGSTPDVTFPGIAIEIVPPGKAEELTTSLRDLPLPIIGTITQGAVRLHLGALTSAEVPYLRQVLHELLGIPPCM